MTDFGRIIKSPKVHKIYVCLQGKTRRMTQIGKLRYHDLKSNNRIFVDIELVNFSESSTIYLHPQKRILMKKVYKCVYLIIFESKYYIKNTERASVGWRLCACENNVTRDRI